ncbi:MAG: PTPDL family protein [Luteolibacter sp.]
MKNKPATVLLCLLGASLPTLAETFKLKDGSTVEGTILRETADSYVLEVQVTKSIRDERTISKADVASLVRAEPDAKDYEAISTLVPTPDMLDADQYAVKIAAVERFIQKHPTSSNLKAARTTLETLKAESAQLAAGAIKISGKMVSPADYQANAYDFDARVKETRIRDFVNDNEFLPALRLFVEFDRDYRNTLAYGALINMMKQVIEHHVGEAKETLLTFDTRTKERNAGLQRMAFEDRKRTEEAIKEESAEIEARYKAEKDAKQPWPTTSPYHKASLEDTVKFGQAELVRLSGVKTILGLDSGKAYREAWNALQTGANAATVTTAIASAKAAGVPPHYLAPLEARAKAAGK